MFVPSDLDLRKVSTAFLFSENRMYVRDVQTDGEGATLNVARRLYNKPRTGLPTDSS